MTSTTITNLPATTGMAILSSIGRAFGWGFSFVARAPLGSAIIVVMSAGGLVAATNALFMQPSPHPAPLFIDPLLVSGTAGNLPAHTLTVPQRRAGAVGLGVQQPIIDPIYVQKTAPVPAIRKSVAEINYDDILALQNKLTALGFFEGKADGYYGPNTANAIRKYQRSNGQKPVGALTPELLHAVEKLSISTTSRQIGVAGTPAASTQNPSRTEPLFDPLANLLNRANDPLIEIAENVANSAQNTSRPQAIIVDAEMIAKVQSGLTSLVFFRGKIDGIAGEETAKAIRRFEVFHNYEVTGKVTPELIDMLVKADAKIDSL